MGAVVLLDPETGVVTVVQPNEDGSYWRKIVRNKMVRMKEVRRVKAAKLWAAELVGTVHDHERHGEEDQRARVDGAQRALRTSRARVAKTDAVSSMIEP